MPYFRRPVMFGDGAKGAATQVHGIWYADAADAERVDTGILETWRRKNRSDPGTTTITWGEETYPTLGAAVDAWAKANGKETLPRRSD